MKLLHNVSLVLVLFGLDHCLATFNFGSSIITIIEDNQGAVRAEIILATSF